MIILDRMNSNNIKHIFMDIDGTLTRWINVESFLRKSCEAIGLPYKHEYLSLLFKSMEMTELEAVITGSLSEQSYEMFLKTYIDDLGIYNLNGKDLKDKMFELEPKETFIMSDVIPTLKSLYNEYILYCYTNWYYKQAIKKLDYHNIHEYFKKIYSADRFYLKFTKVGFNVILNELNAKPNEVVMIGDSKSDIEGPSKLGINTIFLDYEYSINNITMNEARLINLATSSITEFSDIGKILSRK